MANKMLIDATHPEETRVTVVRGNRVEEFDFEAANRKQLRGNIYLAKVTRVEPSLQAAFVEYGGNRHGFLAFSEIHPDYYQLPEADRKALEEQLAAEAEANQRERERREREEAKREAAREEAAIARAAAKEDDVVSELIEEEDEEEQLARLDAPAGDDVVEDVHALSNQDLPSDAEADKAPSPETEAPEAPSDAAATKDVAAAPVISEITSDDAAPAQRAEHNAANQEETEKEATASDADAKNSDDSEGDTGVEAAAEDDSDAEEAETSSDADAQTAEESTEDSNERRRGRRDHRRSRSRRRRRGRRDNEDTASDYNADADADSDSVDQVGNEDAMEEVPERPRRLRDNYKIQEVIKRRQLLLVQVVKEERGNKGAALTTYLSLAGRYSVLMPNTDRGGGISRKITKPVDRKRLKQIASDLDVPRGMGVILRTAGASRTKAEIKRDFEYLLRLWESVRSLTLNSAAPRLVYEEGSLIKRSIRDLYNKDIDQVLVSGEEGYREAKDFMRMLMPSHSKNVQPYRDASPLFTRFGVEAQLDAMFSPEVTLKSGGYIVINQTEALVSIDVNSGKSTREQNIEDTALATNLEAAEEISRQLRLRDLAGLVVIDFIDMEESRNNRAVERRLKECLKSDRARIQVGRISHFGLLEMSRQRMRTGVLESSSVVCPHCRGSGIVRSVESVALHILRSLEEQLLRGVTHDLIIRTPSEVCLYILNQKRYNLMDLENRFGLSIAVMADDSVTEQHFALDRGEPVSPQSRLGKAPVFVQPDSITPLSAKEEEELDRQAIAAAEAEAEADDNEDAPEANDDITADEGDRRKRRRRRRRRSRGEGDASETEAANEDNGEAKDTNDDAEAVASGEAGEKDDSEDEENRRKRRRGRRGGRRSRRRGAAEETATDEATVESTEAATPDTAEATEEATAAATFLGQVVIPSAPAFETPDLAETSNGSTATAVETKTAAAQADVLQENAKASSQAEKPEAVAEPAPAIKNSAASEASTPEAHEDITAQEQTAETVTSDEPVGKAIDDAPASTEPDSTKPVSDAVDTEAITEPAAKTETVEDPSTEVAATQSEAGIDAEQATEQPAEAAPEMQADTAPAQDEVAEQAEAEPAAPKAPKQPVVTRSRMVDGEQVDVASEEEEPAPRRGGWWQRRNFL
ncbi:Rne/Rng family ribonuclease [Polycladidibacter hongkongensis]|uniref:Rne/Rng family ribonuclease n=1 Tax=Polycladidibacter hongkongensis TaxID=1647556 RepID=UPI00082BDEC4|nr:Rne/Rng family ribonuclease [Pseudovibrio hongkongensis]